MNSAWNSFLQENGAILTSDQQISFPNSKGATENVLSPITDLTAFGVAGEDAELFLQGQLTCDTKEIQHNRAGLAAYCNAKGRVISTLLLYKTEETFVVILPRSLLNKVMNKLRMYILRAKVQLQDFSDQLCLLGLTYSGSSIADISLPQSCYDVEQNNAACIRLPGNVPRYLITADSAQTSKFWSNTVDSQIVSAGNSNDWSFQDISSGLPWFDETVSEEYIPQMLNIDKLGGISFNKGCYIGQEIVARTHYLGKAKRELLLAECSKTAIISSDTTIIDRNSGETAGKIIAVRRNNQSCRLLFVTQAEKNNSEMLVLNNSELDTINIIPFQ